jgi:hypothetical protein
MEATASVSFIRSFFGPKDRIAMNRIYDLLCCLDWRIARSRRCERGIYEETVSSIIGSGSYFQHSGL